MWQGKVATVRKYLLLQSPATNEQLATLMCIKQPEDVHSHVVLSLA